MDKLVIEGNFPLKGEIKVSGSKNSALPILAATLLTDEECVIKNVPRLRDTMTMMKLLRSLGKVIDFVGDVVTVKKGTETNHVADYDLVSTMRGSFCVLGPLLGKLKKAKVSMPGGCVIGIRPVDLHIKGVQALGAKIEMDNGYVIANAKNLKGSHIYLGGTFGSSVLATANVMMAATLAQGETIIESAACEPEIEDLTYFLIAMGAEITGVGSPRLVIKGVKALRGATHRVIPDRIEAGTYIMIAVATRSPLVLKDVRVSHLMAVIDKLKEAGVKILSEGDTIRVKAPKTLKPVSVTTHPYPGFPTDLQAQFIALMSTASGISVVTDKVYPDRFMHIAELNRMGAHIRREGANAVIEGVKYLDGAPVMASDLRASAALVIAGLMARGKTAVHRIYHLERGYENLDKKLTAVGAKVSREKE